MANLSRKQPAKNIAGKPPTKTVIMPDGTVRTEKLCPIPLSVKMVDPDGNVVMVPLANGYTIRSLDGYGHMILSQKIKAGFLRYDECPVARGTIPAAGKDDHACPGSDGRGKFSKDKCCSHVDAIIQRRRVIKKKKCDEFNSRFVSKDQALIDFLVSNSGLPAEKKDPKVGSR